MNLTLEEALTFARGLDFLIPHNGYGFFRIAETEVYLQIFVHSRNSGIHSGWRFLEPSSRHNVYLSLDEVLERLPEEIQIKFLFHLDFFKWAMTS